MSRRQFKSGDRVRWRILCRGGAIDEGTGTIVLRGHAYQWRIRPDGAAGVNDLVCADERELEHLPVDDAGLTRFGVIVWVIYLTGIGIALWLALWWTLLVFACCMAVVGLLAVVEGRAIRDDLDRREEVRG